MKALGNHTLLELYECDPAVLDHLGEVREIMLEAARRGKATIVTEVFHQFSPQGISGVIVIAESHLAIHTWPEHGFAAVDLFSCSQTIDVSAIEQCLKARFRSERSERIEFARGSKLNGTKIDSRSSMETVPSRA